MNEQTTAGAYCPRCGGYHMPGQCLYAAQGLREPQSGWACPKCGRVYGPLMMECTACNKFPVAGLEEG